MSNPNDERDERVRQIREELDAGFSITEPKADDIIRLSAHLRYCLNLLDTDIPEPITDDDLMIISEAVSLARRVQDFIWLHCYPSLRPYDAEGWRRLFQKRVDSIALIDLTQHGGLATLRKRLLQQAALSIRALGVVNRWAKTEIP